MSYKRITPFATLGRPLEKQAFAQGMRDVGNGLWNTMAGKANTQGISNSQDWNATKAGVGGMMNGGFHGAGAAADKSYNAANAARAQQTQRADAGWNQAKAGIGGMVGSVGKYFSGIGSAVMGNSPAAPKPAGAGPAQVPPPSVATATQPAVSATPQPPTNQFNQPGGWTTGPNGEIQPMQKQSAFAMLSKSAYGYQMNGSVPTGAIALPKMPAMANIAPLGGSVGSMYGQTIKAPAPTVAPDPKPTGMPAAGTPVTPGMSTDERMHAQNKLNPSAGGTVAVQKAPNADDIAAFRKQTGTNFDPKSRMDMQNMRRLMGGSETIDRKQYGMTQRLAGPQLNKTAFAQLEKVAAGGLAGVLQKGIGGLGKMIGRSGAKAKSTAGKGALDSLGVGPLSKARPTMTPEDYNAAKSLAAEARGEVGNTRVAAAGNLKSVAGKIGESKGIQNAINYGAGTVAGGAGLIGAHSMGHSSGRKEGVTEGTDSGIDLGLQGAQAMKPGDPGFMGRLGDLFTGTDQGPDAATMRQGLTTERDKLIQSLLAR